MAVYPHAGVFASEAWPNQRGQLTPGALVGIYNLDGITLTDLFDDRDRTNPVINPITLNAVGNNDDFYAEPASYLARRIVDGVPQPAVQISVPVDPADAVLDVDGPVVSVNGQTGVVELDAADVGADTAGAAAVVAAALAQEVEDRENAISQEVIDRNAAIVAAGVGLWDDRGNYDASTNLFPATGGSGSAGAVLKGDLWTISVVGTLGGQAVSLGDTVRAKSDAPGQTAGSWAIAEANLGYTPENVTNKSNDPTLAGDSSSRYVTEHAAKGYTDAAAAAAAQQAANLSDLDSIPTALINLLIDDIANGRVDPRRYSLALDGVTDDSAELATLITALNALSPSSSTPTLVQFPACVVKLWAEQLPAIDPTRVKLVGPEAFQCRFDFSGLASGPAVRMQIPSAHTTGRITALARLTLYGPQNRDATLDAIGLGGAGVYANLLDFDHVTIDGFRDQIVYGTNSYLNRYVQCTQVHARRYFINFSGAISNCGENEVWDGGLIANGECGIGVIGPSVAPQFTFIGTSFDFLDRSMHRSGPAGTVDYIGCHFEADYRSVTDLQIANGSVTATSASAVFTAIDTGKNIADAAGVALPAGTTFTVVNATTITLSQAATATGTITAKIASDGYWTDDLTTAQADHAVNIVGGQLVPSWDSTIRTAAIRPSGTPITGQFRLSIDGLSIATSSAKTSKYLVYDTCGVGGNGINQRSPNTYAIRGLKYPGTISTSYTGWWPLRLRDQFSREHILSADIAFTNVADGERWSWQWRFPQLWETVPRHMVHDVKTLTPGTLYVVRVPVDAGWVQTASALFRWYVALGATLGASLSQFRIALYWGMQTGPNGPRDDTNLVQLAQSGNQIASMTANSVMKYFTNLASAVSPYTELWLGVLAIGTVGPDVWGVELDAASPLGRYADFPLMAGKLTGQSSLPASIVRANLVDSEFIPWLAINPTMS